MPTIRPAAPADPAALAAFAEFTFRDTFAAQNTADDMAAYCASAFSEAKQLGEIANHTPRARGG